MYQAVHDCTPADLHAGFAHFWGPWWCRDSPQEASSLSEWGDFMAILGRFPAPWEEAEIDMLDLRVWRHVLNKSRTASASGACGFSVAELKQLPDTALLHMAQLFQLGFSTGSHSFS